MYVCNFMYVAMYMQPCICICVYVLVTTQDEYDIFVITGVQGKAEDECCHVNVAGL